MIDRILKTYGGVNTTVNGCPPEKYSEFFFKFYSLNILFILHVRIWVMAVIYRHPFLFCAKYKQSKNSYVYLLYTHGKKLGNTLISWEKFEKKKITLFLAILRFLSHKIHKLS